MSQPNEDRRRFFRINDAIGVSYRVLDENADDDLDAEDENTVDLASLLKTQSHIVQSSLNDLKKNQPAAAQAISALDKKLDLVIALLEKEQDEINLLSHGVYQASISACGIGFPVDEPMDKNTQLQMSLMLEESKEKLSVLGRVVGCHRLEEDDLHYLRIEFLQISEQDKEKLIQYILQRQSLLLRSLKDQIDE